MDLSERRATGGARHPWEQARAQFFDRLADEIVTPDKPVAWLDVGAGDAWLGIQIADSLPAGSSMVCWDVNYTADDLESLALGSPHVDFVAQRPTVRADVISLLDVLEHVDDDVGFLRSLVDQNLADDGTIIVSVPAYQQLFTAHDTALAHHRRYSPSECRRVLHTCGLRIDREGGLFSTLLAPRAVQKGVERLRRPDATDTTTTGTADTTTDTTTDTTIGIGGWNGGQLITKAMTFALNADAAASRWMSNRGHVLPGLSYWAVCRRSET